MRNPWVQAALVAVALVLAFPVWWLELAIAATVAVGLAARLRQGRVARTAVIPLAALAAAGVVLAGVSGLLLGGRVVDTTHHGPVVWCATSERC